MMLVSKFMVHRALSDKRYLSLGLLSPLIYIIIYVIYFCIPILFFLSTDYLFMLMFPIYVPNCFALLIRCVKYIFICIYLTMFISCYVCLKCRGRVVTNVLGTCDQTLSLYIFGNKVCLS